MSAPRTDPPPRRVAFLIAAFAMFGPFSIDAIFPGFPVIAADLAASPVMMQQIISVYLGGFGLMSLFSRRALGRARAAQGSSMVDVYLRAGFCRRRVQVCSAGGGVIIGRAISSRWVWDMMMGCIVNCAMNAVLRYPHLLWAVLPIGVQAFGIAFNQPLLTLQALERFPKQHGAAASMQAFLALGVNATVSGLISPAVSISPLTFSATAFAVNAVGFLLWLLTGRGNETSAHGITAENAIFRGLKEVAGG